MNRGMNIGLIMASAAAFIYAPVTTFAHEVSADAVSRESHLMIHIMEIVFALSFVFCAFVVYQIFKDYQKKKTTGKTI